MLEVTGLQWDYPRLFALKSLYGHFSNYKGHFLASWPE